MTYLASIVAAVVLAASSAGAGGGVGNNSPVALIADPGGNSEAQTARECYDRTRRIMEGAGIALVPVTQDQVLAGALDACRVAVIPYAPNLSEAARGTLKTFCGDGGKVICFFNAYGLERELGLRSLTYVGSPKNDLFRYVRFRPGVLPGLPDGFPPASWNIESAVPLPDTRVLADWLEADGKGSNYIAATLSDGGLFYSHILLPDGADAERNAGLMLRAAVEYLSARAGQRRMIAIVRGTVSEKVEGSDGGLVPRMVEDMSQVLDAVGLTYVVLSDEAVEGGALKGRKVAILPLNFKVSDGEVRQIQQFVAAGGKVIGCFSTDGRLLPLMGVTGTQFRSGGATTPYNVVHFNDAAPATFPGSFHQRSSNTMQPTLAPDGKVIATWRDTDGTDTGCPAVVLSPTGMYFSYILFAGDLPGASRFMLAAIAQLAGGQFYTQAADHAAASLWDFRRYRDQQGLLAACSAVPAAAEAAAKAVALEQGARQKLGAGDAAGALDAFAEARSAAEQAFIRTMPSRGGRELRAAWRSSPYVRGDDWDAFFTGMRQSHLNAFLPNVSSGGSADYQSDVLPLSSAARERGDQMEKMLSAAHRHGIEVYLWRTDFILGNPGKEAMDRLAAEGRVCLDPQGKIVGGPDSGTLCPSNLQNQQLEIAAMVEMASKFHPDGIHFDYIRYPGSEACFCSGCRERFEQTIGHKVANWPQDVTSDGPLVPAWNDFRRAQINLVVRETSAQVRKVAPGVMLSAAVFSDWDTWARNGVAQDWPMWVKEGYLDFVCPMDYTQDVGELARSVAKQRTWVGEKFPLEIGLGAWVSPSAWHLADLLDTARTNGADGIVFFEYQDRVVTDLIPPLLEGPLREDAKTPWAP